jgi:hypothetical protein
MIVHEMVVETLVAAAQLDHEEIGTELASAAGAIRMLIAGKHLGNEPLVLRAEPLRLEITVVTGNQAAAVKEKLGGVPGAATATDWTLHLPSPPPIRDWIVDAARPLAHVTTNSAPAATTAASSGPAVRVADIDLDALRRTADR